MPREEESKWKIPAAVKVVEEVVDPETHDLGNWAQCMQAWIDKLDVRAAAAAKNGLKELVITVRSQSYQEQPTGMVELIRGNACATNEEWQRAAWQATADSIRHPLLLSLWNRAVELGYKPSFNLVTESGENYYDLQLWVAFP